MKSDTVVRLQDGPTLRHEEAEVLIYPVLSYWLEVCTWVFKSLQLRPLRKQAKRTPSVRSEKAFRSGSTIHYSQDMETIHTPGEPGMQPRDPCVPWRGKLGPGHTLR